MILALASRRMALELNMVPLMFDKASYTIVCFEKSEKAIGRGPRFKSMRSVWYTKVEEVRHRID